MGGVKKGWGKKKGLGGGLKIVKCAYKEDRKELRLRRKFLEKRQMTEIQ